jgi:hypothetical protein
VQSPGFDPQHWKKVIVDRTVGQEINKETENFNNTLNQLDPTDTYRYPTHPS